MKAIPWWTLLRSAAGVYAVCLWFGSGDREDAAFLVMVWLWSEVCVISDALRKKDGAR